MGKRLVSGALIAAFTVGMLSISAVSASATASQESEFVSLINHERTTSGKSWSCGHSGGLRSLTIKSDLVSVARKKSAEMAAKGTIWHDSSTWNSVSGWKAYGENVGMGPMDGVGDPVKNLHVAFMNSSEHCVNVLYKSFNQVGVGVVVKDGVMYVTEIFVQRGSTTTTTTTRTTTTTTHTTSTTTHSTSSPARTVAAAVTPKPKPKPPVAVPQTVDLLVRMVGMDADQVDPATGAAAGF